MHIACQCRSGGSSVDDHAVQPYTAVQAYTGYIRLGALAKGQQGAIPGGGLRPTIPISARVRAPVLLCARA